MELLTHHLFVLFFLGQEQVALHVVPGGISAKTHHFKIIHRVTVNSQMVTRQSVANPGFFPGGGENS